MGRDVGRTKGTGADEKPLMAKTKSGDERPRPERECKEGRGGWRDVFDNLKYSSGPGDNIYVFG